MALYASESFADLSLSLPLLYTVYVYIAREPDVHMQLGFGVRLSDAHVNQLSEFNAIIADACAAYIYICIYTHLIIQSDTRDCDRERERNMTPRFLRQ